MSFDKRRHRRESAHFTPQARWSAQNSGRKRRVVCYAPRAVPQSADHCPAARLQEGTVMIRIAIHTIVATLALSAAVTASGPKFTSTWKAPEAAGVSFTGKKVAALIMSDDQGLRVSGEEA